jgi:hypothetical protein
VPLPLKLKVGIEWPTGRRSLVLEEKFKREDLGVEA